MCSSKHPLICEEVALPQEQACAVLCSSLCGALFLAAGIATGYISTTMHLLCLMNQPLADVFRQLHGVTFLTIGKHGLVCTASS